MLNVRHAQRTALLSLTMAIMAGGPLVLAQAQKNGEAKAEAVPASTPADIEKAEEIYKTKCSVCHAADGNSPLPNMSFADGIWRHGSSIKEVANTITNGVPATAMMPFKGQFTEGEILALAKKVRGFDKKLK